MNIYLKELDVYIQVFGMINSNDIESCPMLFPSNSGFDQQICKENCMFQGDMSPKTVVRKS